jgi:hypothetical protein
MTIKPLHLAGAAFLCAFVSLPTISAAQTPGETGAPPSEEAAPAERIIVPRLSDRAAPETSGRKSDGPIDWEAVRALIAMTRERDAEFERSLRAMTLTRVVTAEERERLRPKGLRALAPTQLQRVSPERVAVPQLPVLAPVTAETAGSLRIAARPDAFTAFGELPNGANFELIGTRKRVTGGGPELMKARLAERRRALRTLEAIDAPFMVSHHEEGVDLSFSKFNAAYQITVYCNDEKDWRCAADDYVVSLAENLVILNEDAGGTP